MATYFNYHLIITDKKTNEVEFHMYFSAPNITYARAKSFKFMYTEKYDTESYDYTIETDGKPHEFNPTTFYLVYTPKRKGSKRKIYKPALDRKNDLKALADLRNSMSYISPYNVWEIYTANWIKVIDKNGDYTSLCQELAEYEYIQNDIESTKEYIDFINNEW